MTMRQYALDGHIHDCAREAQCRVAFLEVAILAISEKHVLSPSPGMDAWTGLYYIIEDIADMLRAIAEKTNDVT